MALPDWYITLSGKHLSDPGSLAIHLANSPLGEELPLWRRANSYECPIGAEPGHAFCLMQRRWFDELDKAAFHELTFRNQFETVTLKGLVLVSAKSMFGLSKDPDSPMLLELQDRRVIMARSAINKGYNVRIPAPPNSAVPANQFYHETLKNGQTPWTWQEMLNDIWGHLDGATFTPTLIGQPATIPVDFRFFGQNAWTALHVALKAIGRTSRFNPIADSFAYIIPGENQELAGRMASLVSRLRQDFSPDHGLNAGNKPASIKVFFAKRSKWYGIERDTPRQENWEASPVYTITLGTGISGARGTLPLNADLYALIDHDGNVTNLSSLTERASTLLASVVTDLPRHQQLTYAGATDKLVPGGELSEVIWRDYGDWVEGPAVGAGQVTVAIKDFPSILDGSGSELSPEYDSIKPGDWGRRTHPIYPHVKQVVQVFNPQFAEGRVLLARSGVLLHGSARPVFIHPGRVRLIRAGLEVLENCWITYLPCFDERGGFFPVYNGARLHGRLSGTATDGVNEYPLYTVDQLPPLLVRPLDCLDPANGPGQSATTRIQERVNSVWVDSQLGLEVWDSMGRNSLTPEDQPIWVEFMESSCRWEIVGEHGLTRMVRANAEVECGKEGSAVIYVHRQQSSCSLPTATNCTISFCNRTKRCIKTDPEDLFVAHFINARWVAFVFNRASLFFAELAEDLCVCPDEQGKSQGSIAKVTKVVPIDYCDPKAKDIKTANNEVQLEGNGAVSGQQGGDAVVFMRDVASCDDSRHLIQVGLKEIISIAKQTCNEDSKLLRKDPELCNYQALIHKMSIHTCTEPIWKNQIDRVNRQIPTSISFGSCDVQSGSAGNSGGEGNCIGLQIEWEEVCVDKPDEPADFSQSLQLGQWVLVDTGAVVDDGECIYPVLQAICVLCVEDGTVQGDAMVCAYDCVTPSGASQ